MTIDTAEPAAAGEQESMSAPDDIRADIRAALTAAREEAPPAEAPAEETATQNRDERGRFAAKGADEAPAETEAGEPKPTDAKQPERLEAPEGWPADARTDWNRLPKALQASLLEDVRANRLRLGGEPSGAATPDPIVQTVRQYAEDAAAVGVEPAQYVNNMLAWARNLSRNPHGYLPELARSLGIDLSQYSAAANNGSGGPQYPASPDVARLQSELAEVRSILTQQQRAEVDRRVAAVSDEIAAWKDEKDGAGNPLRPYYSEIPEMALAARIQLVRAAEPNLPNREVLQRAYEAEIYATPTIRERELARLMDAKARAEADKQAAQKAKARAVSVRDARAPMSVSDAENESLRDTIKRAMMAESRV